MVVRDNKAAAAPVTAILITSKCVEHQLFFDPFVMISIQPVRTLQIQKWLLSHKQILCHCLSHETFCRELYQQLVTTRAYMFNSIYMGCLLFLESAISVCVCVCQMGEGGV